MAYETQRTINILRVHDYHNYLSWQLVVENLTAKIKLIIQVIMPDGKYQTVDEFRKIWKTELLPSIRQEVKLETELIGQKLY